MRMRHIVNYDMSSSTIFFYVIPKKRQNFLEEINGTQNVCFDSRSSSCVKYF